MKPIAACCAAVLLAACSPKPAPNFSGRWKMDPARSRFAPARQVPALWIDVIEHREPAIRVKSERRSPDAFFAAEYSSDGGETCNVMDGAMVCSRAHWNGAALLIDSTVKEEKGDVKRREIWSLAPDGHSLTVQRSGPAEEFVFLKRQ